MRCPRKRRVIVPEGETRVAVWVNLLLTGGRHRGFPPPTGAEEWYGVARIVINSEFRSCMYSEPPTLKPPFKVPQHEADVEVLPRACTARPA